GYVAQERGEVHWWDRASWGGKRRAQTGGRDSGTARSSALAQAFTAADDDGSRHAFQVRDIRQSRDQWLLPGGRGRGRALGGWRTAFNGPWSWAAARLVCERRCRSHCGPRAALAGCGGRIWSLELLQGRLPP